jgi:predicted HD phosphohydrolase
MNYRSITNEMLTRFRTHGGSRYGGEDVLQLEHAALQAAFFAEQESAPVRLRRWDESAKLTNLATPYIEHFAGYLDTSATSRGSAT